MPTTIQSAVRTGLLALVLASTPARSTTSPDVVIVHGESVAPTDATPSASRLTALEPGRLTMPSTFYVLPVFTVDPDNLDGESTLIAIRNEHDEDNLARVQVLDPSTFVSFIVSETLAPKQVWTLNLRDVVVGTIPPDVDGLIRGVGRITGAQGLISADRFQIEPDQDFATGGLLADVFGGDFCRDVRARFLVGGPFSGGTTLTVVLDTPLGDDPMVHPPSITGTAYREDASEVMPFMIFTSRSVIEVDIADLVTGANFGSLDLRIEGGIGGFVEVSHKALGRYSVSLPGVCLDPPPVRAP